MFIRKRDPRYIKETLDEAKLQATLLAASQSQAAKAKAEFQENLKQFKTQEWMEAEPAVEVIDEEESEIEEEFECVACKKSYKNERYDPCSSRFFRKLPTAILGTLWVVCILGQFGGYVDFVFWDWLNADE
jgi:hypothetical protein